MNRETEDALIPPVLRAEFDGWKRISAETMARLDAREGLGWKLSEYLPDGDRQQKE